MNGRKRQLNNLPSAQDDPSEVALDVKALHEEFRALREDMHHFRREVKGLVETPKIEIFIKAEKGATVNTSYVGRDNYAPIAVNSTQVIGSIRQNIGVLQQNSDTETVGNALAALTDAIKDSSDFPSERERKRLLEDVEELTTQARRPKAVHEKGVIGPIIDRLAEVCGAAGGLVTVWQAVDPAIRAFFGF